MASWHELCVAMLLQKMKINYIIDCWVQTEFSYWPFQADVIILSSNNARNKFFIDLEADDISHETKRRAKKDLARDNCLIKSTNWKIQTPYKIKGNKPWVVLRIPYKILDGLYYKDKNKDGSYKFTPKEFDRRFKPPRKNRKYEIYKKKLEEKIEAALNAAEPKRILWEN